MFLVELIISLCLVFGALIAFIGALGLVRLPDIYSRLHGPTKASTLGVGATLFGSFLVFTFFHDGISMQEALITAFIFTTAPVSANMLAKAALHRQLPWVKGTQNPPKPVGNGAEQQSAEN
ncbi:Na+/H+ antiporter subunit G [Alkalimonas amylolytica]|uniref:Multisubunit potassium/proton antiporter, PhaG subunit (TC 2.A.63.1.1) n=1 Tax=Alkalimonas amylolytica TaxID=152573 RepID=A0A1H4EQL2_ALKAM|nr:Na+/H+ antiporter subunit G [Alkalimonas amylolytica]SEA87363.1 multisubunit potassium/proton antiporter, PhaG subunit (TC 2.A.63.1.1) [Alkalimonas amylolytica]